MVGYGKTRADDIGTSPSMSLCFSTADGSTGKVHNHPSTEASKVLVLQIAQQVRFYKST